MVYHTASPVGRFGWIGVDLFFVLSGFLITNLLVREHQRNGRISLPKFWGRRFLRLMPAYWLVAGTVTVCVLAGVGATGRHGEWTPGWFIAALWGYFYNFVPQTPPWIWQHQELTAILWSLAVEEQFYLVWPFLCALALTTRRPWLLGWLLVALVLACRALTRSEHYLALMLHTRGLTIIAGCTVALMLSRGLPRWVESLVRSRGVRAGVVLACVAFAAAGTILRVGDDAAQRLFVPIAAILFPCLIAMLWYGPADRISRVLGWSPFAYAGMISYGMYLYHPVARKIVIALLYGRVAPLPAPVRMVALLVAYFAATLAIASISYWVWERPFLRLKERLR
jgi:peptidoglycan/LPS O-acetylase OafA/YrhL